MKTQEVSQNGNNNFEFSGPDLGTRIPYLEAYYRRTKANILLMAYRGYSESDGEPSEQGLQKDGLAIMEYIFKRTDINKNKIIVHGRSLGGGVTIYVLSHEVHKNFPVAGVILENTFTSIPDMVAKLFPYIHVLKSFVLRNYWPSIERISRINCPKLFISGLQDEIVPASQMRQLYDKSSANKYIVISFS
jgi:fermentation-respiration switch protein FrsA (DUF1100 family)